MIERAAMDLSNIHYIKIRNITCDNNVCKLFDKNNYPLYSDEGHLSIWGRDLIAPILLDRIGVKM